MKIKRYMAESMRAALAQVRAEQGADAVILSSRRVAEGIEVIAAVDYDEALFAGATQKRTAIADAEAPQPAAAPLIPETLPAASPTRSPMSLFDQMLSSEEVFRLVVPSGDDEQAPAAAAPARKSTRAPDGSYHDMQRELKELREMLRGELAQMSWNEKRPKDPLQARVLEQLTAMDISPDVAMALAARTPKVPDSKDSSNLTVELLATYLRVVDKLTPVNGGVIALVGATGAGKTTTIGKLATRWSMQHGSQDLALVSTDGYRVGARDQLMTYSRLLGAPLHTANSGEELAQALERLKSKKLILIDTAGMGPRDVRLKEQLAALKLGAARARVYLTLPAHGEANALDEAVRSFANLSPDACILTKVDEAASLGAVLSTTLRHKLRIAYLCNGQRVPEDLHAAYDRRLWLARTARKLKENAPARLNDGFLTRNSERVHTHV
ncbi:MAG: flagellar biosynthesis protein FlhF [Gammaproteobacteria bacterium]|jgi:flagellar biosynthesis protein FlhF|nr:flagellar biosynthesis protein FlhF [Gammaproteobacteria bacterium]